MDQPLRRLTLVAVAAAAFASGLVAQSSVPAPDQVFATVNDQPVTYAAFYTVLQDQAGRLAAERVILTELLHQRAAAAGITVTDDDIDARVAGFIDEEFGGKAELFTRWVVEGGLDEAAVRRQIESELLDLKLRSREVEVTDDKLRAFFEAHRKDLYDKPDTVRYRQIVCDTKEKADAVLGEIKEGRLTFFAAALRHSIDRATSSDGGMLQPQVVHLLQERAKPIFDAIENLPINEMTPAPVEFGGKWFLLLMVERLPGQPVAYERVAERVRHDYLAANATDEDTFIDQVLRESTITGLPLRFQAVQAAFRQRAEATETTGAGPTPGPMP